MKVLPLFKTSEHGLAVPEINKDCKWVLEGKGFVTAKLDGINVQVINGALWKRTANTPEIESYMPADDMKDKLIFDAYWNTKWRPDGVYEVVGPGVKGNPHKIEVLHMVRVMPLESALIMQGDLVKRGPGVTVQQLYDSIHKTLSDPLTDAEGIVFQIEEWVNGKFVTRAACKVTKRDFGLPWPPSTDEVPLPVPQVPAIPQQGCLL